MTPTKSQAILSLAPGSEFSVIDDVVTWYKPKTAPVTDEAIEAELARLQAEYNSSEYQRLRASEYPPIGDQLDALFHAGVFPPEMAAQLQAVKDKYPKN
jgi:hypothetical protein